MVRTQAWRKALRATHAHGAAPCATEAQKEQGKTAGQQAAGKQSIGQPVAKLNMKQELKRAGKPEAVRTETEGCLSAAGSGVPRGDPLLSAPEALVGRRLSILFDEGRGAKKWYPGVVTELCSESSSADELPRHRVLFDDSTEEVLDLKEEDQHGLLRWEESTPTRQLPSVAESIRLRVTRKAQEKKFGLTINHKVLVAPSPCGLTALRRRMHLLRRKPDFTRCMGSRTAGQRRLERHGGLSRGAGPLEMWRSHPVCQREGDDLRRCALRIPSEDGPLLPLPQDECHTRVLTVAGAAGNLLKHLATQQHCLVFEFEVERPQVEPVDEGRVQAVHAAQTAQMDWEATAACTDTAQKQASQEQAVQPGHATADLAADAEAHAVGATLTVDGPNPGSTVTLRVGDAVEARYHASKCSSTVPLQLWQVTEWYTGHIHKINEEVR